MSKNRQNKSDQKDIIHTILMIVSPSSATHQLRKRILNQRGAEDHLGIVTQQPNQLSQSNSTREVIFNTNLKNESSLNKLIQSQGFDTVYIDLKQADAKLITSITKAMANTKVSHVIMSLNGNDKQNDPQVEKSVDLIKHSGISYTIVRRAELNQYDLISYKVVKNAQPVNDSTVSPSSVADFVYQSIKHPDLHKDSDLGIAQLPYK